MNTKPRANLDPEHCLMLWNMRKAMTHDQLALVMGLTRNGVADIEKRAMAKIRDALIKSRALERKAV
jgi:DNA-directed RNA polymerase sigma subunit (sigma70/sigma32)